MGRNFLKGVGGDRINALLAGIGTHLRKVLAVFGPALREWAGFCVVDQRIFRYWLAHSTRTAA